MDAVTVCRVESMFAQGSFFFSRRAGRLLTVIRPGSSFGVSSDQATGVETGAPSLARGE